MQDGNFPKTNLTPALIADAVHRNILALGFSEREIRRLFQHTEFLRLPYKFHQLCFFDNYARESLDYPVSPQELATLFELNECTVRKNLLHGPQQLGSFGRHVALDGEVELSLVQMLLDAFHEQKAMTQTEFLKIVKEQQNPKLTKGCLHDFIGRHLDELQICRSLPREDPRMAVPRAYLEDYIRISHTHITGRGAELVFNLDELRSADWEDRKAKKVIAPAGVPREDVHHPVSRRHRHTTLLACVSASGEP